mmetsp:Transcript_14948/g.58564  ORF Transcript_14948/g.58564 Transcript_14948/m.58564 type:complete len:609 (-) Transcript_14948:30-1856(-)
MEEENTPEEPLLGSFYVRALEARGLKMKMGSGTRNSYVQFRLGDSKKTVDTPVVWKSLHPVWKEKNSFNFEVLRRFDKHGNEMEYEYLDVALWDKNAGVGDTFLGYISIRINTQRSHSRTMDKWFTLKKREKATGEIHLQLRFVNTNDRGVMLATEESMEDAFDTVVEFDDTELQLVKADREDNFLSKTNELLLNRGKEAMGHSLSSLSTSTKLAAKASAQGVKSAAKKARDKRSDMALKRMTEKTDRVAAMNEGQVVKRGFMLQMRSKSSLPFKTWKKRYYTLVGAPLFQLRAYEGPNSTKKPSTVDLSDLLEVVRVEDSKQQSAKGSIGVAGSLSRVGLIQPPHYCQFAMQMLRSTTHMACLTAADMEDWYTRIFMLVEEAHGYFLEQNFSNGDFNDPSGGHSSSPSLGDSSDSVAEEEVEELDEKEMELKFSLPLDEEADNSTLLSQHMKMRRRYTVFYEEEDQVGPPRPSKPTAPLRTSCDAPSTPQPSPLLATDLAPARAPKPSPTPGLGARAPSGVPLAASISPRPLKPSRASGEVAEGDEAASVPPPISPRPSTSILSRSPRSPRESPRKSPKGSPREAEEDGDKPLPPRPRLPTRFKQPE